MQRYQKQSKNKQIQVVIEEKGKKNLKMSNSNANVSMIADNNFRIQSNQVIQNQSMPLSIIQTLTCPICLMILPMPHEQCQVCDNNFCKQCLTNWWVKHPNSCIFKCENPSFKTIKRSNTYNAMVDLMKIKCKNCEKILQVLKINKHQFQCPQKIVLCVNDGCQFSCKKKDIAQHMQNCQYQYKKCKYCFDQFYKKNFENHEKLCPYRTIKCQNNGCNQIIKQKNYAQHVNGCLYKKMNCQWCHTIILLKDQIIHETNCQLKIIQCRYCKDKFLIKDFQVHQCKLKVQKCQLCQSQFLTKNKRQHHEQCLWSFALKLKQSNNYLLQQNQFLKKRVDQLENIENDRALNQKQLIQINQKQRKVLQKDMERVLYSINSIQKWKKGEFDSHLKFPHLSKSLCPFCNELQKKFKQQLEPLNIKKKQIQGKIKQMDRASDNLNKSKIR